MYQHKDLFRRRDLSSIEQSGWDQAEKDAKAQGGEK